MTNDRAVEMLNAIIFLLDENVYTDEVEEAIHMAINALTAQPEKTQLSEEDATSDCISRQAAIDAIDKALSRTFVEPCGEMILKDVPSAQPETAKFIRWMECKKTDNYISYTPHCKCSKCGTEFIIETIKYCYICGARMEENNEAD